MSENAKVEENYYHEVEPVPIVSTVSRSVSKRLLLKLTLFLLAAFSLVIILVSYSLTRAPSDFVEVEVFVPEGSTVRDIVQLMEDSRIVRSNSALYITLLYLYHDDPIKAGTFVFTEPMSLFAAANFLTSTTPKDELIKITFPEGMRVRDYADIAARLLPEVSAFEFNDIASSSEGSLWPETYLVRSDFTAKELFNLMTSSFSNFMDANSDKLVVQELTQSDVITLASIVEREANTGESMRMVASILQNRLEEGMPLQADATIEYVLDTPLGELPPGMLAEHLRELDSPYNTYLYKGLPPGPIGNPGAMAIQAVLEPTVSDFFFYVTDDEGDFHYARTFAEHQRNISTYLR